jgi:carbonic anhydrase
VRRWLWIAVVAFAGCEQWKAPQRIGKLEDRVNDLAEDVAELRGAAGKPKARAKSKGEHGDKDAGSGSDAHASSDEAKEEAHGAKEPADDSHAAKVSEHGDERAEPMPAKDREPDKEEHKAPEPAKDDREKPSDKDREKPSEHDKPSERDKGKDPDKLDKHALEQINALAASGVAGKAQDTKPHWGYEGKSAAWGKLDPAWKVCVDGKEQSPIDIEPHVSKATPISFHYKPTAATVTDNGHTLQVNLAAGSSIEIDGRVFDLLQFHFHTPSEHTIAGEHYPLEVHLVHQGPTGKLAVIGVLYDVGAESRPLAALWPPWPRKVGVADKLAKPFDPTSLLPETRTVYRYNGSLTTPPCSEGVLWNVMRRTPSDGRRHLEAFAEKFQRNAREIQARNDRAIQ